jgi:hypothetical protein
MRGTGRQVARSKIERKLKARVTIQRAYYIVHTLTAVQRQDGGIQLLQNYNPTKY